MTTQQYFVRIHGKVLGPFAAEQLCTLRDRGQFRQFHEVSEDRRTWRSAASLWVFRGDSAPPGPAEGISRAPGLAPPGAAPTPQLWYYADERGAQQGPLPGSQLVALRRAGKIAAATLVWREGLSGWLPFSSPEVNLAPATAPPPSQPAAASPAFAQPGPQAKRRVFLIGGVGVAAAVLLALAGVGIYGVFSKGGPAREAPLATSDQAARAAGAALIASEARVWALEGNALKEAQEILTGSEARTVFADDPKDAKQLDRERRLREFLRKKRSAAARAEARAFIEALNSKSRRLLTETATRLTLQPEDLILEWLTYEAALDYGIMTRIWRDQGNYRGEAAGIVRSMLEGMVEPPATDKGVHVKTQSEGKITLSLFGARVVEEVQSEPKPKVEADRITISWKSNYGYLRDLVRGEKPRSVIEETLALEDGRYKVDYQDWFAEYLAGGHRQMWATEMFDDSALAVAAAARDDKAREKLGQKPADDPRPRRSLRELFARLAPAVPVIELAGIGDNGSGFLIQHGQKYLVITNRHVIENASNGVAVHFITASGTGPETRRTVPVRQTTVIAVHRKADVAIIDVTPAARDIRQWGIEPVTLAPRDHVPPVGEHVFAIGHPGAGDSGQTLTRTLSDGIVSATGRKLQDASCIQVTVPLNPGNSGGPLFDDEGRVVGVNTYIIRKNQNRDLALEALNFSLENSYVHELLTDRGASLDDQGIAQVLNPRRTAPTGDSPLVAKFKTRHQTIVNNGYRPYGGADKYSAVVAVKPGEVKTYYIDIRRGGAYAVSVVSDEGTAVGLAVVSGDGTVVAADTESSADPLVSFTGNKATRVAIVVSNESTAAGVIALAVYSK